MLDTQELLQMGSMRTPSHGRALKREIGIRKRSSRRIVALIASKFT